MIEDEPIKATKGEAIVDHSATAINLVPFVGGALSDIARGVLEKRQNRRLNSFLSSLAADLERLKGRLNQEFLQTEDAEDMFEEVLSKAADTRKEAKLDAMRHVFVNSIIGEDPDYDEVSEILKLIDSWQERHLIMLRIFADPLRADEEAGNVVGSGGGFSTSRMAIMRALLPDWEDDQISRTAADLHSVNVTSSGSLGGMITDRGIHQLQGMLTSFGTRVTSYLKSNAEPA